MNYLGHLLLTYPHRALTMGNLLGDFMRREQVNQLSPDIRSGFAVHHMIDNYTDTHPEVRELIKTLRPVHAKYTPVVVDILMDHVLAREWERYADLPYPEFTNWVYALVPEFLTDLDTTIATRLRNMVYHQWIDNYDIPAKLLDVLMRMDARAKFPSRFVHGIRDIEQHYDVFADTFHRFYFALQEEVAKDIEILQTRG